MMARMSDWASREGSHSTVRRWVPDLNRGARGSVGRFLRGVEHLLKIGCLPEGEGLLPPTMFRKLPCSA
jgi:hypothetical protein